VAIETEQERVETGDGRVFWRELAAIPNLVSLARVVLIYIGIWLWYHGLFALGLGIGVIAGLSDYLDGYLARRLNMSTRIGGLIDQAADILFMMGVIFIFVRDGTWPAILLFTVMFRETIVMNLRASAAEQGFSLPSIFLGKWSSNWMFWSLAVMAASRGNLFPEPLNTYARYVAHFGMTVGITSSVITAVIYLQTYVRNYKPTPPREAPAKGPGPRPPSA
jgi:CDP-diacylglycerol--glycerol-3-phosphate 3-phosphatidyltransferase